jgi:hypothetical protein
MPDLARLASPVTGAATLADSLARIDPLQDRTRLRSGPQDGWRTCAEILADQAALRRWVDRTGISLLNDYGHAPERTGAAYVMAWYLSIPGFVAGMLFHHERRVPSLRPEHLAFTLGASRPEPQGTAVLSERFACLPGDPAAGRPGVDVVPDERVLAAVLRGRFAAHAARFVTIFGPIGRIDRRTLWGAATDAVDNALLLAGRAHGNEICRSDGRHTRAARHAPTVHDRVDGPAEPGGRRVAPAQRELLLPLPAADRARGVRLVPAGAAQAWRGLIPRK